MDPRQVAGLRAPRGPPQHGPHAGHQLAQAVGLGDVVVGADLERHDGVDLGALGRDHDDGDLRAGADGPADVDARQLGQHEVQQQDVGHGLVEELQGLVAVAGHGDPEALVGQADDQRLNEGLLVLGQQDLDRAFARRRPAGLLGVRLARAAALLTRQPLRLDRAGRG